MSQIVVSPAARRWLTEHGGVLTLRTSTRNGCCGGRAAVPVAEARMPDEGDRYRCHAIDGLRVFVEAGLDGVAVRIDIDRLGPWSKLYAEARILPGNRHRAAASR